MDQYYDWIKVAHIIAMTAWMAGMFYLPRLYAYHAAEKLHSPTYDKFIIMERRLLRIIMDPALVLTIVMGLSLAKTYGFQALGNWFYIKMCLVAVMFVAHVFYAICRRDFELGRNKKSPFFFKVINEFTTIVFIAIVIMVVIKPFDD